MNEDSFREHLRSLEIDETLPGHTLLRPSGEIAALVMQDAAPRRVVKVRSQFEFELGKTLGEGGTGVVHEASQIALGRTVAAKTLRSKHSERQRQHLLDEARVTGSLEHPNIVPIYSLGTTGDGLPVILMKRVDGVPWSDCIARPELVPSLDGRDPLTFHLEVLEQVCRATHYAHAQGVVHRDIKPDNVMLGAFGEVYLVDWGIALRPAHVSTSEPGLSGIAGTPAYMAPEMTLGDERSIGPATDIYLLGATLCEIITGEPPHRGKSLFEVLLSAHQSLPIEAPGASPELVEVCRRAMRREPADRFASVEELRQALIAHRQHRASEQLTQTVVERLRRLEAIAVTDGDEREFRSIAGEIRFGLRQALELWADNERARAEYQRWLELMIDREIRTGNLAAAEALFSELDAPPEELTTRFETALRAARAKEEELAVLEQIRDENDPAIGARSRWYAAAIGVAFWTVLPLIGGQMTEWGDAPLSMHRYVAQSTFVVVFMFVVVWVVRRRPVNVVQRQITSIMLLMACVIPPYRIVATVAGLDHPTALAVEHYVYGLAFAAAGVVSGHTGWFPLVVSFATSLVGALNPALVYPMLACSNFLLLVWAGLLWRRQERGGGEPPPSPL